MQIATRNMEIKRSGRERVLYRRSRIIKKTGYETRFNFRNIKAVMFSDACMIDQTNQLLSNGQKYRKIEVLSSLEI